VKKYSDHPAIDCWHKILLIASSAVVGLCLMLLVVGACRPGGSYDVGNMSSTDIPSVPMPVATSTLIQDTMPTIISMSTDVTRRAADVGRIAGTGQMPPALYHAVTVGDVVFEVEIARTDTQRTKGLSGRSSMPAMTGMLFVFEMDVAAAFWMKEMLFSLDFIWISDNCTVVDITLNVPAPDAGTSDSSLLIYRPEVLVAYALEINAGEVQRFGVRKGDVVKFSESSMLGADC